MKIRRIANELRGAVHSARQELKRYYRCEYGIKPDTFLPKSKKERYQAALKGISENLGIGSKEIENIFARRTEPQGVHFFADIASAIKTEAFKSGTETSTYQNRLNIIRELSEGIERPLNSHYSILNSANYTTEEKLQLLRHTFDKNSANLIAKLAEMKSPEGKPLKFSVETILKIAESENADTLLANFDRYHAFLAYKGNNPDFLSELEQQLAKPDSAKLSSFTNSLNVEDMKRLYPIIESISKDTDLSSASHGLNLFSRTEQFFSLDDIDVKTKNEAITGFIKNLILTTTKENSQIRYLLIKNFGSQISSKNNSAKIAEAFMTKLDSDEEFCKMFKKMVSGKYSCSGLYLDEIMYYADVVGAKYITSNFSKFLDMVNENPLSRNNPDEVAKKLCKHLANKYYMPYREELMLKNNEANSGTMKAAILKRIRLTKSKLSKQHENENQLSPRINETFEEYITKLTGVSSKDKKPAATPANIGTKAEPSTEAQKNGSGSETITSAPKESELTGETQKPITDETAETPKTDNTVKSRKTLPWIIGAVAGITAGSILADKIANKK